MSWVYNMKFVMHVHNARKRREYCKTYVTETV